MAFTGETVRSILRKAGAEDLLPVISLGQVWLRTKDLGLGNNKFEYELGKQVALKFGISCERYDTGIVFSATAFNYSEIQEFAKRIKDAQSFLEERIRKLASLVISLE